VDLIKALETAFEVLERLGGETRQVHRCRKIVHRFIQVALVLNPPVTDAQRLQDPTHGGEQVQLIPPNTNADLLSEGFMAGLDSDMALDLSSFTDNLGSLIPDMYPL
jgi:hypothetical protein